MNNHQQPIEPLTTFRVLAEDILNHLDAFQIHRYGEGVDGVANGESIGYGKLDSAHIDEADAVTLGCLIGSDYNGGALVRSNIAETRKMVENIEKESGETPPIVNVHGGYGTDGILVLLDRAAPEDSLAPFVDLLRGLLDYPVVDEEAMSKLEHDDENQAWADSGEADFARALVDSIGGDLVEIEDSSTVPGLRELFQATADSANLNGGPGVIHEDSGPYFMTDDAAKHVSPVLLFALGFVKLDADAMLDLAVSSDTGDHDEARRIYRLSRLGFGLKQLQKGLASAFYARSAKTEATHKVRNNEADRQASDIILRAEIDAGDTDAGLAADLPRAARIATVTLDRFIWQGGRSRVATFEIELDPSAPYDIDHDSIRDFVQDN